MPDSNLAVQQTKTSGEAPTFITSASTPPLRASTDKNLIPNDGRTILYVENGLLAANITIATPGTVDGLAIADRVVAVPAGTANAPVKRIIGPFPQECLREYHRGHHRRREQSQRCGAADLADGDATRRPVGPDGHQPD